MEIELDLTKNVEKNAEIYYEKAKKLKRKIQGAEEALALNMGKLKKLEKDVEKEEKAGKVLSKKNIAKIAEVVRSLQALLEMANPTIEADHSADKVKDVDKGVDEDLINILTR